MNLPCRIAFLNILVVAGSSPLSGSQNTALNQPETVVTENPNTVAADTLETGKDVSIPADKPKRTKKNQGPEEYNWYIQVGQAW